MTIDEKQVRAKSNDRSVKTKKLYLGIVVVSGAEVLGVEPRPRDCVENYDHSITRCYSRNARCSAGSDNCCNASRSRGRRNSRPPNIGRMPWDDEAGGRSAASGPVFQDQGVVQSAQPVRARVPVPCPCGAEPSGRRAVDSIDSSRFHTANWSVPPAALTPLNRRGTCDVQPPPCGDQNARRCDCGAEPEPQNCSARSGRRGTYDVSRPCAALRNDRRGTYDVSRPCAALRNDRRNTTCGEPPARSSDCGGVPGTHNLTLPFTMTGTIRLMNGPLEDLSPVRRPPPTDRRSSSCSRLHDTDGDIDDFLDNHLDYDMVAPRAVALPGQPYVRIDESAAANTTPEEWRLSTHDRSSLGSQAMGVPSPARDYDGRGSRHTFGPDDSLATSGTCDRQSRARSAAPACGSSSRDGRRRDTFDRCTR